MILTATESNIIAAADLLKQGELVAFPTETVYGLGADASNESAVKKIFAAKGRPFFDPLIVHILDSGGIGDIAHVSDAPKIFDAIKKLERFWPGPLTIIVPKGERVAPSVCGGLDTVGIRVPAHPVARRLLEVSGLCIAAPSANPFNYVSPTTAQHVSDSLGDKVQMILDGGPCAVGVESTILSLCTETPTILRSGAITAEMIAEALGEEPRVTRKGLGWSDPSKACFAPGMLDKHYAPKTPIKFLREFSGDSLQERIGAIRFSNQIEASNVNATEEIILSKDGDLNEVAHNLFAAIRKMDALNLDLILVDSCNEHGIGAAIMERLRKATA